MSYTKKVVVGFGVVFLCLVLASFFSYLLRLLLARALTPAEFGLVYAVFALFGFIGGAQTLGLSDALVQYLPGADKQQVKTAFLTVVYTQLLVMGTLFLVAFVAAPWLATSYFHAADAQAMVIIYGLAMLLSPLELTIIAFFQGMGKTTWYGYLTLARAVFLAACTALLLWLGWGIFAPVFAYLFVYLLVPLVYVRLMLRVMPEFHTGRATIDPKLLRQLLIFGVPIIISSTVGVFLTYIDTFFLTLFRTLPEVGLYNVALPTAGLLWFIGGAIYSVMLPLSSEMRASKRAHVLEEGIGRMYLYLLIILLPFTAVLLLFPQLIINVLFGGQYVAAALAMQLLAIGGVFYCLSSLNMSILIGLGKPSLTVRSLIGASVVNVVGDVLLIPRYGIAGSAFATLVAFAVLFGMNMIALRSLVRFVVPYGRISRLVVASALFGGTLILLRGVLVMPLLWKTVLGLGIGAVVYVALLFVLRVVSMDELRDLRKLL